MSCQFLLLQAAPAPQQLAYAAFGILLSEAGALQMRSGQRKARTGPTVGTTRLLSTPAARRSEYDATDRALGAQWTEQQSERARTAAYGSGAAEWLRHHNAH